MPAAEGAVAAAAVADQMYGPKEDRKLVIVLVIFMPLMYSTNILTTKNVQHYLRVFFVLIIAQLYIYG